MEELETPTKRAKNESANGDASKNSSSIVSTSHVDCDCNSTKTDLLKSANDALQESNKIHYRPEIDETKLGIELFVGDTQDQFHGLIKTRYADFIVHEVDNDGETAYLTNLNPPENDFTDEASLDLGAFVDSNARECMSEVNSGYLNEYKIDVTGLSKDMRTNLHHAIRQSFDKLESFTVIESEEKQKDETKKDGSKPSTVSDADKSEKLIPEERFILVKKRTKNSRPKNIWPRDRPDYTHFILYKENRDTIDAIHCIASAINMRPSNFSSAGVKDRRAVTTQWISSWRLEPRKLIAASRRFNKRPIIKVGNFCFKKEGLKVGQLKANKFDIVIRNLVYNSDGKKVIEKSMNSVKDHGFFNYFGLQRFGTRSSQTHDIGLAILQSNWEKAVDLVISYRYEDDVPAAKKTVKTEGEPTNQNLSKHQNEKKWANGAEQHNQFVDLWKSKKDANLLFKKFPHFKFSNEGTIIRSLSKSDSSSKDYLTAIIALPRNMRSMYVHSYQSFIWNKLTTFRIKKFGFDVIAGDLVINPSSTDACLDTLIASAANTSDEFMTSDDCIKAVSNDKPESQNDLKQNNDNDTMHYINQDIVIITEENKKNFTIFDVVLPLVGSRTKLPQNDVGKELERMLQEDNLTVDSFKQREKIFVSYGSYRKIMVKPMHVDWYLKSYSNPNQSLVSTDLEKLEAKLMDKEELDKRQQLNAPDSDFVDEALVVEFELPPSSYATMCLREIMKKPSTEFNNRF